MCATPTSRPQSTGPAWRTVLAGAALVLAAALAYANSFSVPFVFDDVPSILGNSSIRHIWPIWDALTPPVELRGLPVGGRPLVNLTLAVNYAVNGTGPAGYHFFNLTVHALAGLVLFGVVRRTLLTPPLCANFGPSAHGIAFGAAVLWTLHPLQTESVTYICQRAESLMALCYLTTVYAFIRSTESPSPHRWRIAATLACLVGMATKEVMVSAPLFVLLYDRVFIAGNFSAALRQRWRFYSALASTWIVLAVLVLGNFQRGGTAGFAAGLSPWSYALIQVSAIPHYLRLALWPSPLVFDYGFESTRSLGVSIVSGIVLAALLALTLVGLRRRPALGLLGAAFFMILAPTSSIVPVATQTMAEHRMYLPLAALTIGVMLALHAIAPRRAVVIAAALALLAGVATAQRNQAYRSELLLWTDTVAKNPTNSRAQNNLGILLCNANRTDEAIASFETALRLRPAYPEARNNLGTALLNRGRAAEAAQQFSAALRLKADYSEAHSNLGLALQQLGQSAQAITAFAEGVRLSPASSAARFQFGNALIEAGRLNDAIGQLTEVLRLNPTHAEAHNSLGVAFMRADRPAEALGHYESALRLKPDYDAARANLGALRARLSVPGGAK